MPVLDDAAANASLANDYGPNRGPNAASSHQVELWDGDPTLGDSAQLSGNGYNSVQVLPADWSAPTGRQIEVTVNFPAPTGPWVPATHWVLRGSDGHGWDYGTLTQQLYVTDASSTGPTVTVTVFYNDDDL